MITALTRSAFASFSSIFRNGRSPVINPSTLILAMWSVRRLKPSGPPASTKARMARAAAMMAVTRQKLRERRSLRRAAIEVGLERHRFSPISRSGRDGAHHSRPPASPLALALDSAAPRISPREAPESEEPLRHRRLLLGDLQRLDRHLDLAGALFDLDHLGIDLLANRQSARAAARSGRGRDRCGG